MANTPFTEANQLFSDMAHVYATDHLYPLLFKIEKEKIVFEKTSIASGNRKAKLLDGEMGTDYIAKVHKSLRPDFGVPYTLQERFRRTNNAWRRTITITEYNTISNKPSEAYKMMAQYFVYGYFCEKNGLQETVVINAPNMMRKIQNGELKFGWEWSPKDQIYLEIKFDDLEQAGLIELHLNKPTA